MRKQIFKRMEKTLAILAIVFFVVSVTAAAVVQDLVEISDLVDWDLIDLVETDLM